MSDQQIIMKVPEEIITAQVRAAVAAALSRDPTKMVEAVVRMALDEKRDHYSRETKFVEILNQMIRDVAKEEFAAFVAEQRPTIKKAIQAMLQGDKKRLVDAIAEKLSNAATNLRVDAYIKE